MSTTSAGRVRHWQQLAELATQLPDLNQLLSEDQDRSSRFTVAAPALQLDLSRQRWNTQVRDLLVELAARCGLEQARAALFQDNLLNPTEQRPVGHAALRGLDADSWQLDGQDVMPAIRAMHARMGTWSQALRDGQWRGASGRPITDVVNIGIGGSFLGPAMICQALGRGSGPQMHFLANVDGTEAARLLRKLQPERTLFIIASKSMTTLETRENARTARCWLLERGIAPDQLRHHFVAISTNADAAAEFGIPREQLLPMWDWVGGRFSVTGPIGLPIAIAHGMDQFLALLRGARAMDLHFRYTAPAVSAPVQLALAEIWNQNFLGLESHAVLPYSSALALLPDYLQQLEMESSGKRVRKDGTPVEARTGTILWGNEGTNGQHAYHQLLHQGTAPFSAELLVTRDPGHELPRHHAWLVANCLAQAEVLARGHAPEAVAADLRAAGRSQEQIDVMTPHRVLPGNHPCSLVVLDDLSAFSLGAIIALHEHKVFVQGIIWDINSFDQWGVELGKQLGARVHAVLTGAEDGQSLGRGVRQLIDLFDNRRGRT